MGRSALETVFRGSAVLILAEFVNICYNGQSVKTEDKGRDGGRLEIW